MGPTISPFSGAYGEYYYLKPGGWIFKVPDEITDEMATPVNCALSQVTYGLQKAGLRYGDTVVVQGAGGLGLNAIAVAKEMGADAVIAIDGVPSRLALAKKFGADEVIDMNENPGPMDRIAKVKGMTGGRGGDVVVEVVGCGSRRRAADAARGGGWDQQHSPADDGDRPSQPGLEAHPGRHVRPW
jgi:threonine dehydrogenase-like Zn-dependent dehydrogenase